MRAGMAVETQERIAGNIKYLRKKEEMSQNQLAYLLQIDRTSLSGYEIGKRTPDVYMLCRIADVFDVSLDVLVGRRK